MLVAYKRWLIAVVVLILILAVAALVGVQYWKRLLAAPLLHQNDVVYELKSGLGANQVLGQLHKQ